MANADNTVNLQIATAYDGSGATAAAQGLGAISPQALAAGQATVAGAKQAEGALKAEGATAAQTGKALGDAGAAGETGLRRTANAAKAAEGALGATGAAGQKSGADTAAAYEAATKKIQDAVAKLQKEGGDHEGGILGHLFGELAPGLQAGVGIAAVGALVTLIESIGEKFKEAAVEGLRFNAEMETETLGLAATLKSVDPDRFLNFDQAKVAGVAALDVLRGKANELGVDFKSLAQAYGANLKALVEGGVTDTGKQIELVSTLLSAAASKGITGARALTDSIDILNGRAGNIVLAKELGLESEALKEAAKNGRLYEEILGKIGGYRDAVGATATSFSGLAQTASNLKEQLLGTFAAESFEPAKDVIRDIITYLQDPNTVATVRQLGEAVGEIAAGFLPLVRVFLDIATFAARIASFPFSFAAGINAATAEANKLQAGFSEVNRELLNQIQNADTAAKKQAAREALIKAEETALKAVGTTSKENGGILDQQFATLANIRGNFDTIAGKVVSIHSSEAERTKEIEAQNAALEKQTESIAKIDAELAKRAAADELAASTPEQIKGRIEAQLANARALLASGGVEVPIGVKIDPADLTKLRDELVPADTTAGARARLTELQAKLSELALSVSDLQRAYKTAESASEKATTKQLADGDKLIDARRKLAGATDNVAGATGELRKVQANLAAEQTANDRDTDAGKKRIKTATDDVTKAVNDLATAEKKRQDAQEKAFPQEVARLEEIARLLREMPVTGTSETADERDKLVREQRDLQDRTQGKKPLPTLDELDRQSIDRANTPVPPQFRDPTPGLDTSRDTGPLSDANYQDTADSRVQAAAQAVGGLVPGVGDATAKVQGAVADVKTHVEAFNKGAGDVSAAVGDGLSSTAGTFTTLAGQMPAKFKPLDTSLSTYHETVASGFETVGAQVAKNNSDLSRRIEAVNTRLTNHISSQG